MCRTGVGTRVQAVMGGNRRIVTRVTFQGLASPEQRNLQNLDKDQTPSNRVPTTQETPGRNKI